MRSNYNILWLDDDFEDDSSFLNNNVSKTEKYLKEKGYISNITKVTNKKDALDAINSNKKIDLFLSDYNISEGDEFSGFDFLIEARKYYKQEMLLYSNQDEQQLKKYIINYLSKDNIPLEYFSKFVFKSANNLFESIKSIIDLTLIRWDELNALRGLYLSETSQLHQDAKKYIKSNISDCELRTNFNNNYTKENKNKIIDAWERNWENDKLLDFYVSQCVLSSCENNLFSKWDKIRNIRNGCAHVQESRDKKGENYIKLFNGSIIMESEISKYRKELRDFVEEYYKYFPSYDSEQMKKNEVYN